MNPVTELRVGSLRTVVRPAGPQDEREAVVFVHGNPGPSQDWTGLLTAVGEFGRAVAWNQPGFGRADKPAGFEHTVTGHAAFIEAALDALGIDRVHLVLHDFGGPWGLEWAATHPDRVASLVLINTGVLRDYRWHLMARIWQTPLLGELFNALSTRSAFQATLRRTDPRLPADFVDRLHAVSGDPATKRAVLRLYRASRQRLIDDWAARTADLLRPLDLPALVVWGAKDAFIPVEQAHRQRDVFPRAEVEILPDSGHWPFADDPAAVERVVAAFLRRETRIGDLSP
ncbi:Pimeloyl-ACP methyl ester carboxylesterase [Actinokineospora alba]|uniref:Pimeloyl-ACP methyl ester carboxylesterase n=1 Tax=Actinokineospora alba TaxID=504798 RepID=A0A1H0F210_9PSEU|nr:alpha/beta fold hydrolase [Actinokineospora alba]TDP69307.1 pimeloyl-ACP methyl ester carboxylesterase [Actinokineospora alba]SDI19668.1 Pimeloyl-ACP methyl ester carboxylesterase [Actinokineospora alba]SDN88603.1 Pimeloyl-ACP methyl ester carboxylesterase [Actinokineospora alba]